MLVTCDTCEHVLRSHAGWNEIIYFLAYADSQLAASLLAEIFADLTVFFWSMMTSSNGNIFRVTGPLCGEFTGPHKGQRRGALMFSLIYAWINCWVNTREAGDSRRHRTHFDVIVMQMAWFERVFHLTVCFRRHFKRTRHFNLGKGLLSLSPPFSYFSRFSKLRKYLLPIKYHAIFDRYRHSWAAVTSYKYEHDCEDFTHNSAKS